MNSKNSKINFCKGRKMQKNEPQPEYVYSQPVANNKRGSGIVKLGAGTAFVGAIAASTFWLGNHLGSPKTSEVKINQDPQKPQVTEQQFYQLKDGTKVQISPRSHRPLCGDPFVKQLSSEQQKELIEKFPAMDGDGDGHCG